MMIQGVSIGDMLNQSMTVLTKPSVESFEQYERRGGQREALTYAAVGAIISGVAGLLVGLRFGILGALATGITAAIGAFVGFFIFAYALHYVGQQQGGTGTLNEVFYTCALYVVPLQAIGGFLSASRLGALGGLLSLVLLVYQAYLGYLAARSSMNLDKNKGIITIVITFVVSLIAGILVGIVLGLILSPLWIAAAVTSS